jgi:hypothetical protein|tara:strand:+ start:3022 stop:3402 length:381 start_codon:yes stop_codon:yes gene_type:complete
MNHFDYLNSINYSKENIMHDNLDEKAYNSFMVNRGLSYFNDTVIYANEMNRYAHIDSKLQYDFLRTLIRKRKRFSKWTKEDKNSDIDLIKEYYGYSKEKAFQVLPLLSKEQLTFISKKLSKGGRKP